jgi:hypothetical protein
MVAPVRPPNATASAKATKNLMRRTGEPFHIRGWSHGERGRDVTPDTKCAFVVALTCVNAVCLQVGEAPRAISRSLGQIFPLP